MSPKMTVAEGLNTANFEVRVNGKPLRLCGVSNSRMPVSIGIVLDTSRSMTSGQLDHLALAKAGVERLLDDAGPHDEYLLT